MIDHWRHSLCDDCWQFLNPDQRPTRIKPGYAKEEVCCRCSRINRSGIYTCDHSRYLACRVNKPKS